MSSSTRRAVASSLDATSGELIALSLDVAVTEEPNVLAALAAALGLGDALLAEKSD